MERICLLIFLSACLNLSFLCHASEYDHKYEVGDSVIMWVNKVGPHYNPQETYNYYSLPFCQPGDANATHKWGGLGEVLEGNQLIDSQIDFKFRKDVERAIICELDMDDQKAAIFKNAIEYSYWFEFFIDDLPLWGFVGDLYFKDKEHRVLLYTHKTFVIKYNKKQIIQVNLTQENPQPIMSGKTVEFSYSLKWVETNTSFSRRFDAYLDYPFFEHQIHWFSIFNSFMMVIFLTGLVSMILMRTLRNDFQNMLVKMTSWNLWRGMSVKNLDGSLCMVMFFDHLEAWCFSRL